MKVARNILDGHSNEWEEKLEEKEVSEFDDDDDYDDDITEEEFGFDEDEPKEKLLPPPKENITKEEIYNG